MKFEAPDLNESVISSYGREIKNMQIARRLQKEQDDLSYFETVNNLMLQHQIKPRFKANLKELKAILEIVLYSEVNGTKAIRIYANENGRSELWTKEIAKHRAGKLFKQALEFYSEDPVIKSMIENDTYCPKDILNNTVTGALSKLSKQLSLSKNIDNLKLQVKELKNQLAFKETLSEEPVDWALAQQLRDKGYSLREIAMYLNVGKSTVSKYTKPPVR
jgi:hypothetical protein